LDTIADAKCTTRDSPSQVKKIVTIVGARPQFIKCAPLSKELRKEHEEIVVHTGQHYDHDMSDVFFEELSIPFPDYNLKIGSGAQGKQTGDMLAAIEQVLIKEEPELVIVYGDTNTTLAGALAASKLHINVAHVEAGLRSYDKTMPEEINRKMTDHISDLHFAPTTNAAYNLRKEGIVDGVYVVGDVMVDAVLQYLQVARSKSRILDRLNVDHKGYLLATVHRQSNTDNIENLLNIVKALGASKRTVVFPVHPRTKNCLVANGMWDKLPSNIIAIEPLGYLDMLRLTYSADKVITDSGGIQKEAYIMHAPCITVRDTTEWVETIADGWNVLVGTDVDRIITEIEYFNPVGAHSNPYGDGRASVKINRVIDGTDGGRRKGCHKMVDVSRMRSD
jgi:UDP-N-acetylglucosamine 2-epimerase (non-hydrolysing)